MYKLKVVFLSTLLFTIFGFKSDKQAYAIFSKDGKQVKYQNMLSELEKADIVFFGEQHNNPICHWLQFEISKDLEKRK
ncbi:MAG: ChaN family lipoprotein, partial [Bacteroidales bacterium]|nr:ChaN family lipoprotein [Bacteroidales bacterium]